MNITNNYFNQVNIEYNPLYRYTKRIINNVIDVIIKQTNNKISSIVDLGCGNGYPAELFLKKSSNVKLTLIDCSNKMILAAKKRLMGFDSKVNYLLADFNVLNMPNNLFDIGFSSSTLHFVTNIKFFLTSLNKIISKNGLLVLLYYDRDDLEIQLFHKILNIFHSIEKKRHYSTNEIIKTSKEIGFMVIYKKIFQYEICFSTPNSFIDFIISRPFSGFGFMTEIEFSKDFQNCINFINDLSPNSTLTVKSQIRLLILKNT
ncbi:MAG: class I SAM-dependent methyltransferase [Candidatus Thorarchaeota archaeon]